VLYIFGTRWYGNFVGRRKDVMSLTEVNWAEVQPGTAIEEQVRGRVLELREVRLNEDGTVRELRCVDPAKRGAKHVLLPSRAKLHEPDAAGEDQLHWQRVANGEYVSRESVRGAPVRIWFEKGRGWALEVHDEDISWHKSKKLAKQHLDEIRA
jgi:hypothetical protein